MRYCLTAIRIAIKIATTATNHTTKIEIKFTIDVQLTRTEMKTMPNQALFELGRKFREERKATGQTLKEVARLAGLSFGYVAQVERGLLTSPPSAESLTRLCEAIGTEPSPYLSLRSQFFTPEYDLGFGTSFPVMEDLARLGDKAIEMSKLRLSWGELRPALELGRVARGLYLRGRQQGETELWCGQICGLLVEVFPVRSGGRLLEDAQCGLNFLEQASVSSKDRVTLIDVYSCAAGIFNRVANVNWTGNEVNLLRDPDTWPTLSSLVERHLDFDKGKLALGKRTIHSHFDRNSEVGALTQLTNALSAESVRFSATVFVLGLTQCVLVETESLLSELDTAGDTSMWIKKQHVRNRRSEVLIRYRASPSEIDSAKDLLRTTIDEIRWRCAQGDPDDASALVEEQAFAHHLMGLALASSDPKEAEWQFALAEFFYEGNSIGSRMLENDAYWTSVDLRNKSVEVESAISLLGEEGAATADYPVYLFQ